MEVLTHLRKAFATVLLVGLVVALAINVASEEGPEYQIKAAMLYNFALFVEWPSDALPADKSSFVLCAFGTDPFGPWLDYELTGMYVGTHPVEIRRTRSAAEARRCHVVFVSRSEELGMRELLAQIGNAPVLTVSDLPDADTFCSYGGMVAFITKDNRMRFALNTAAMTRAGLKSDSRLKRLAITAECGAGR